MGRMSDGWTRRGVLVGAAAAVSCGRMFGSGRCGEPLTSGDLDSGIELGAAYLARSVTSERDFVYEVDWQTGKVDRDVNGVRQSGATWGLVDHAVRTGDAALLAKADEPLTKWLERKKMLQMGTTFAWRGTTSRLGTTALLGLAIADRMKAPNPPPDMAQVLDGIVRFVQESRFVDGGFNEVVDTATEVKKKDRSPYADGEALLFLATMAVRHGRPDLLPMVQQWAERDWVTNVEQPLAADPDPDRTKGYYQWASMSWAALIAGGHDADKWGRRLTDLGSWMVDVHGTLKRTKNTAYAYEGIVPAFAEAVRRGETTLADHFACTIHQGLGKLCSWQLGHPRALPGLAGAESSYHGGVQNHAEEPGLRIDVTQHQLHAMWLAKDSGVTAHIPR